MVIFIPILFFPFSVWAFANASSIDYPSAWHCDHSKFIWYCEVDTEKSSELSEESATPQARAIQRLEALQKALKGKRALAILEPTPENVTAYIDLQNHSMEMASFFSDVWRRVIWQTPALNYELKRPVNNAALDLHRQASRAARMETLEKLGKEWGIFFFFRSDCPYCHVMSETLAWLSQSHGITIFPVSLDGTGLPRYPAPRRDNGLAAKLGVEEVPLMVLGNVRDKRLVPLGSGVISSQEMIERIHILTSTRPGDAY
jgi:conjugal transfer pilus assembly protein TraF